MRFPVAAIVASLALTLFIAGEPILAQDAPPAAHAQTSTVEAPTEYEASWQSLHMGTLITGKVFGKTAAETERLAKLVESEIVRFDDMMSVHKETVLNEVNRRAGEWVAVTPEIAEMTKEAILVADMTDGAFEPTIGPLVNLWKIGFGGHSVPSDEKINEALKLVDHSTIAVKEENGQWYLRIGNGQNIDMGAIAKGYIGQKLADRLKAEGAKHALLDLGGNVVAVGDKPGGQPWRVGLQCPDQTRGAYFAVVTAIDESVITSGAYERNFEKNGKRYGHILSAKTGRPVQTDLSSVTIVDANGAKADALCTALFGMGEKAAQAFLEQHADVQAVLLSADFKTAFVSDGLQDKVRITDPSITVKIIKH